MVPLLVAGPPVAAPAPPQTSCTVTDDRLAELSGLVVDDGVWAMSDGGRRVSVHRIDDDCAVVDTRTADIDPYDAEDLALGPDGAMWVADIGDNDRARETVAVIVLADDGARLHRLTYPDGPHDAEALLVDAGGVPYVITKELGRPAGVYRGVEPPQGVGPTPMELVAQVSLPASDTEGGPLGPSGSRTVTGAAATADGRVVALRSYTDAWLFEVPDGDLGAALSGVPVRVPLPDEPQGEAVAFTADGDLLSASEARGGVPGELRVVPGAASAAGAPAAPPVEGAAPSSQAAEPAPVDLDAPPQWLPAVLGGGVAVGLLVVAAAALSWRGRR